MVVLGSNIWHVVRGYMTEITARVDAEGRILFAHPAEPAEQVRIAAKLREPVHPRKGSVEITEETVGHAAIVGDGIAAQS